MFGARVSIGAVRLCIAVLSDGYHEADAVRVRVVVVGLVLIAALFVFGLWLWPVMLSGPYGTCLKHP